MQPHHLGIIIRQPQLPGSCYHLRFSYHAVELANLSVVVTVHAPDEFEPHRLVDLGIRLVPTTFKIAFDTFRICLLGDFVEQGLSHTLSLRFGQHAYDVQKVVAFGVRPDFLVGFRLARLPNVISLTLLITHSHATDIILTLTFNPPRPCCRFITTWFPQSRQSSKPFQNHSPHVNGLSVALGGIHMAIPRTLSEPSSLATWNRALRRPHRQRMRRDMRLRFKSICLIVSGANNKFRLPNKSLEPSFFVWDVYKNETS